MNDAILQATMKEVLRLTREISALPPDLLEACAKEIDRRKTTLPAVLTIAGSTEMLEETATRIRVVAQWSVAAKERFRDQAEMDAEANKAFESLLKKVAGL